MTAFAVHFKRDKITIAADSLMYLPDQTEVKPLGFMSKVLPLQHLRAAIFSRGQAQIAVSVYGQLLLMPQLRSIDDAAEALPALLRNTTETYCTQMGIFNSNAVSIIDISLCGWSEAKGRMQLWQYCNCVNDYEPMTSGDIPEALHACPQLPSEFNPALKSGAALDDNLVAVIVALGKSFAADPRYAGCRVGGDVVKTTITPAGIDQQTIARLPGYEVDAVAGAAVYARLERGEIDVRDAVRDGLCRDDDEQQPAVEQPRGNRQQRRAAKHAARRAA